MVRTATGTNNYFRVVEHIHISEIQEQAHGYFGLLVIVNVIDPLPSPFTI